MVWDHSSQYWQAVESTLSSAVHFLTFSHNKAWWAVFIFSICFSCYSKEPLLLTCLLSFVFYNRSRVQSNVLSFDPMPFFLTPITDTFPKDALQCPGMSMLTNVILTIETHWPFIAFRKRSQFSFNEEGKRKCSARSEREKIKKRMAPIPMVEHLSRAQLWLEQGHNPFSKNCLPCLPRAHEAI